MSATEARGWRILLFFDLHHSLLGETAYHSQKRRRLMTYTLDERAPGNGIDGSNEKPLNGRHLPKEGSNLELTEVTVTDQPGPWWTLGFEAFDFS
jgi:hypothetical protein